MGTSAFFAVDIAPGAAFGEPFGGAFGAALELAFGAASEAQPIIANEDRTIVVTRIGSRDIVDT